MTDSNVIVTLSRFFKQIYQLGDSILIYSDNGFSISLNTFLISLICTFIVLVSLVNVVRAGPRSLSQDINAKVRRGHRNEKNNNS